MWRRFTLMLTLLLMLVGCSFGSGRDPEKAVRARAQEAMQALQAADGPALAKLAHPSKGVRFSPHGFIRTGQDGDVVLSAAQLKQAATDQTRYRWGFSDGSGEPIESTIAAYLQGFTTREYLRQGQVAYDKIIKQGNTLVNIQEAYPDGHFVEYHLPGTGEQADYNWSSVRLVFEQVRGTWYLVGVSNDRWTI